MGAKGGSTDLFTDLFSCTPPTKFLDPQFILSQFHWQSNFFAISKNEYTRIFFVVTNRQSVHNKNEYCCFIYKLMTGTKNTTWIRSDHIAELSLNDRITESCLQRVRVERAPGYNERISLQEINDSTVGKFGYE